MWLYKINRHLGPVIGSYWRLRLRGEIDSIPTDGPLLVASNHSSFVDPWFIGMCFPRPIRYLMTEKWYYRSRISEAIFSAFGTIPINGGNPRETIETVALRVLEGDAVGVFPEGRISNDGRIQKFRSGVARIAARTRAPVVPVGIRGGYESIPRTRRVPRLSRVTVHVGRPIVFEGETDGGVPTTAQIQAFNEELFARISRLADRPPVAVEQRPADRAGRSDVPTG
jgi:1-acyl-sn-glycerol-3-phosphate acyltransferase